MTAPPSSAKRWTALVLFVVAPLILLVLAAANALEVADTTARVSETQAQLDRYRARLSGPDGAADGAGADMSPVFVSAASRSLAEAELQRRIVAAIDAARAQVVESGAVDLAADVTDNRIEIRATLDVDNAGLLRFLHSIETGMPIMFVDELAVRRLQSDDNETADGGRLRVDTVIRAYWEPASS